MTGVCVLAFRIPSGRSLPSGLPSSRQPVHLWKVVTAWGPPCILAVVRALGVILGFHLPDWLDFQASKRLNGVMARQPKMSCTRSSAGCFPRRTSFSSRSCFVSSVQIFPARELIPSYIISDGDSRLLSDNHAVRPCDILRFSDQLHLPFSPTCFHTWT